jgi:preprotein translocase subunit SecA
MYNSLAPSQTIVGKLYPEREEPKLGKVERLAAAVGGLLAPWLRPKPERFSWIIEAVNAQARSVGEWSEGKILEESLSLRPLLRKHGYTQDLVGKAFALVREVAHRTLSMRPVDVQLVGGLVLVKGMVAEMETGEGKTLTATLPASTLALAGVPVHIITVNDYLAKRDADWMRPLYEGLGLRVGTIVHGMDPAARREAYRCDITYCTNKEVAFDYLRDRIILWDRPTPIRLQLERLYGEKSRVNQLVMRGLHFAIVDEADSVLIDEARTPLIISSEAEGLYGSQIYKHAMTLARELVQKRDFHVIWSDRMVELTGEGAARIHDFDWSQAGFAGNEEQREELVRQALVALYLFHLDKHYLVKDKKVQIIDEYTGRLMADRSWERGLHQLIELKEGCEITSRKETKARISYQRFFRRYLQLAGMTGTAREVAGELWSIYRMRVVTVPTHRPLRRRYLHDRVCRTADEKWTEIVKSIARLHDQERPVLVGTRSVEASEKLSTLLGGMGLPHKVLNARQDKEEAEIIALAGQSAGITVATNMAGRGTDIRLGPGVAERGGLHVIASERHEAGRIDRQLFGRCGRQGDPGTSEAFVSLDDELISVYVWKPLRWLAQLTLSTFLGKWLGRVLFGRAQRSAERLHARMRRNLLKMDEQLSESLAFSGRSE